ncbi:MAG: tripartite tricarboxylate transporter permease, partial [Thermoplasmata archaeon]
WSSRRRSPYMFCYLPDGLVLLEDRSKRDQEGIQSIKLSRLKEHIGQAVVVDGIVSEQEDLESAYIVQGKYRARVYFNERISLSEGLKIRVFGIVEGKRSLLSHLLPKVIALGVFFLSGALGYLVLSTPGLTQNNWYPIPQLAIDRSMVSFFPLFTGLFGVSTMLISLMDKPCIPMQQIDDRPPKISTWRKVRAVFSGTIAGTFVGWFPGISSASATVIAKLIGGGGPKKRDSIESSKEFMVAISGVNTATGIFTIMALFVILRARSGAMKAVQLILEENIVLWEPLQNVPLAMSLMLFSVLLAALVSYRLTLFLGKVFSRRFSKIPYQKLVVGVLCFLVAMIFLFTGPLGLIIGGVATSIGLIPPLVGVKRVHLMGCLILPIMSFFFG